MIIGADYHPSFQTIAFLLEETGECGEQELENTEFPPRVFMDGGNNESQIHERLLPSSSLF